ncbi:MAG TPA: hypothetical protein DDY13_13640 [Cytophagales bacterium]|jgi:uncharacterized protein RhaS with RHS repeats|nr:hypothetical protein [Cytophagales bacterium]
MYDPVIGRAISIDPARQFWSPYVWVGNDPINMIDPDGRNGVPTVDKNDGQITYRLPELIFSPDGETQSYSNGFWNFMRRLDELIICNSCPQDINPFPVQFVIWGEGGEIGDYSSKPNPDATTYHVNYDDIAEILDLFDAMFPNSYKATKGTLTEQRNKATNIEPSLNKVAIQEITLEAHALVNKYNNTLSGAIESFAPRGYAVIKKPDSVWHHFGVKNGGEPVRWDSIKVANPDKN